MRASTALRRTNGLITLGLTTLIFALYPLRAQALSDEIQVYDAHIAPVGVFNLTVHDNYIANGRMTPDFPGGLVPNHSLNGVPEWAYGVAPWFEAGLYLPLYSVTPDKGPTLNGFKLRALFVEPNAEHQTFFYGVNFEFSYNAKHWDADRFTAEIRPIVGLHLDQVDFVFNPILDNNWSTIGNLDFAPATRLAYNASAQWAVALEEYDDFGPLRRFNSPDEQSHQLFAVVDYASELGDVEFGAGFGLTPASDNLTFKLIVSRDLN